MNRIVVTAIVATTQLALVGVGVAPQLSARATGDTYLVRVAPVDPIDPFRGTYVALDYPDREVFVRCMTALVDERLAKPVVSDRPVRRRR